ncbi:MAG: hypothetical protein COS84_02255, partial [Armatimonadetes bacterium CG07_land_8_20_14_0_80_40_9]
TSWEKQIVDSERVGTWTSIALDSNNYPHISYCDWTGPGPYGSLKYARWDGTSWEKQIVDSEGSVGYWTSIALDSSNYPHISYFDETNDDLKYAKWNGTFWDIQAVDSEGNVGQYTSIALDSNNYPHISYKDWTFGYLKYATTAPLVPDPTPPIITNLTPPDGSTVTTPTPTVSAIVTDGPGGSGVNASTIRMVLDGNTVSHSYNSSTGLVSHTPDKCLANGLHSVRVWVSDNAGNPAKTSWSFTVEVPPQADVKIEKWGYGARPGFDFEYRLFYSNIGGITAENITVVDTLPPQVSYVSSSPAGAYSSAERTVTWNLGSLLPAKWALIKLIVHVPSSVPLGTELVDKVSITTTTSESDYGNNTFIFSQEVVGSWDPNDKCVAPEGFILPDETLFYIVHFENLGTAEAIHIRITDTLSSNLDETTFLTISDNGHYDSNSRTITWDFPNIMLPPGESGLVYFEIKPKAGLPVGTEIRNKAEVYFDFNPPIDTPTVVSTIGLPQAVNLQNQILRMRLLKQEIASSSVPHSQVLTAEIRGAIAQVEKALSALQAGRNTLAVHRINACQNQLQAFVNMVSAQSGKKIPQELAQKWIAEAEEIIADLEKIKEELGVVVPPPSLESALKEQIEEMEGLKEEIARLGVPHCQVLTGILKVAIGKAKEALSALQAGRNILAVHRINACQNRLKILIKSIQDQRGIPENLAQKWVAEAEEIIAELEKIKEQLGVSSPPKKKDGGIKGDLNSDGKVDEADFEILKKAFNSEPGDENWNPECDLNGDGEINLSDFGVLVEEYNK